MKYIFVFIGILLGCLLINNRVAGQGCHGGGFGGGNSGHQEEKAEKKEGGKNIEVKERFYSNIYVCSMHPEVQSDKSGKCPKCGMKLEKKQVLMTYACPEKDCEIQKAKPGECPVHKKALVKCEVKQHCPKCGQQVNAEELIHKPVKPANLETQKKEMPDENKVLYTCTMHPEVQRDKPGKCPKCGMSLVPAKQ